MSAERHAEARELLLRALDDLDAARDAGRDVADMVVLVVVQDAAEGAYTAYSLGLEVAPTVRLGTLRLANLRVERDALEGEEDEEP